MTDEPAPEDSTIEARCYFVRERNALVVRAAFGPLFVDYYLHLMQHSLKPAESHAAIMKDALAAFTLYLASRPWKEVTAWTVNLQDPLLNVFVTGSSLTGSVVGRLFENGVRKNDKNMLYSQVNSEGSESRQSIVEIVGDDFFAITEQFHNQSDQRPARFFEHSPEDYILVTAQPQCDLDWLEGLDTGSIRSMDKTETLSLLETRKYRFLCGCDIGRILPVFKPMGERELDDFFSDGDSVNVHCPRCGASFPVTREDAENIRREKS